MVSAKNFLLGILVSSAVAVSASAQTKTQHHPLDALTTDEYWTVHDVLQESGHMNGRTLVASLLLHEPVKGQVLAWKQGDPIPREADVILEAD
jgi:primary-amine oxidase